MDKVAPNPQVFFKANVDAFASHYFQPHQNSQRPQREKVRPQIVADDVAEH
jgi:hypothetical protein